MFYINFIHFKLIHSFIETAHKCTEAVIHQWQPDDYNVAYQYSLNPYGSDNDELVEFIIVVNYNFTHSELADQALAKAEFVFQQILRIEWESGPNPENWATLERHLIIEHAQHILWPRILNYTANALKGMGILVSTPDPKNLLGPYYTNEDGKVPL